MEQKSCLFGDGYDNLSNSLTFLSCSFNIATLDVVKHVNGKISRAVAVVHLFCHFISLVKVVKISVMRKTAQNNKGKQRF